MSEILALCKKEHGAEGIASKPVALEAAHLPAAPADGESIALASVGDIAGVNQLAPGQTLPFEAAGLTIVYGPNGSGKSGYGRVLKRACRARKAGEIMPDAYNPPPAGKATGIFAILKDGVAAPPINWTDDGKPDPVLSAVSVFDRDCGSVHVQEKNEVAFRPFGLDIPDDLAGVCQALKQKLDAEESQLTALRDPVFEKPTWNAATPVGAIMSALSHDTDLVAFEKHGDMTADERARLARLEEDLLKNPADAAAEQRLFAGNVRQLIATLDRITTSYDDEKLTWLKALADAARHKRAAADLAARETFDGLAVPGVGGETWRALWEAARRYSEQTAYPSAPFPPSGDKSCVLCHQALGADAQDRLGSFETFVRADAESQAARAEQDYSEALAAFKVRKPDVRVIAQARKRIALQNPSLARKALRLFASADLRRLKCHHALSTADALVLPPFSPSPKPELEALASALESYAVELDEAADAEGRDRLIFERDSLRGRAAVSDLLETAKKEVNRLDELRMVHACIADTTTNAITKLGNDIADNVITPKMRDQFQSEIVHLAAEKVRVEIVRAGGRYGSPIYQVRLFANPKAKVHMVLSEGEQTCVALAAFLTELATAHHKSALVFDDPVTSLDHRWRERVAERLVEESATRQIIVFTHDMVFVNDLHDKAIREGVPMKQVSLSRGPAGTGMVTDGLPWQHAGVRDRIDKLEKAARDARKLYDANDEERYRDAAVKIYDRLRATWERGLEDIAFAGVIHRHRDYIDTKNLKRVTVIVDSDVETFRKNFKKCSDLVDAHDPSRARDGAVPPPNEVYADIQTLAGWADSIRTRQNALP
ncbi:AAA family ATPase [Devosia yakushimensis]|uniref:AAA family ATPase n=1 Tax=Devosia yakushimensis TaxID=470028 RepID=UPI0024E13096|nr:AAA family ATPase [Devosia yakushimensis]